MRGHFWTLSELTLSGRESQVSKSMTIGHFLRSKFCQIGATFYRPYYRGEHPITIPPFNFTRRFESNPSHTNRTRQHKRIVQVIPPAI